MKHLLQDMNGDNLWNQVLKHRQAELKRQRRAEDQPNQGRASHARNDQSSV